MLKERLNGRWTELQPMFPPPPPSWPQETCALKTSPKRLQVYWHNHSTLEYIYIYTHSDVCTGCMYCEYLSLYIHVYRHTVMYVQDLMPASACGCVGWRDYWMFERGCIVRHVQPVLFRELHHITNMYYHYYYTQQSIHIHHSPSAQAQDKDRHFNSPVSRRQISRSSFSPVLRSSVTSSPLARVSRRCRTDFMVDTDR